MERVHQHEFAYGYHYTRQAFGQPDRESVSAHHTHATTATRTDDKKNSRFSAMITGAS